MVLGGLAWSARPNNVCPLVEKVLGRGRELRYSTPKRRQRSVWSGSVTSRDGVGSIEETGLRDVGLVRNFKKPDFAVLTIIGDGKADRVEPFGREVERRFDRQLSKGETRCEIMSGADHGVGNTVGVIVDSGTGGVASAAGVTGGEVARLGATGNRVGKTVGAGGRVGCAWLEGDWRRRSSKH